MKYQWPETGAEKLEISPTNQTMPNWFSSNKRTSEFKRETVKMFGLVREDKANPVDVGMEVSRNIIHSKRVNARKKLKICGQAIALAV